MSDEQQEISEHQRRMRRFYSQRGAMRGAARIRREEAERSMTVCVDAMRLADLPGAEGAIQMAAKNFILADTFEEAAATL